DRVGSPNYAPGATGTTHAPTDVEGARSPADAVEHLLEGGLPRRVIRAGEAGVDARPPVLSLSWLEGDGDRLVAADRRARLVGRSAPDVGRPAADGQGDPVLRRPRAGHPVLAPREQDAARSEVDVGPWMAHAAGRCLDAV